MDTVLFPGRETLGLKYRSMKALFSGVAPGRAWNPGTSSLMPLSQPFASPQPFEGQTINRTDALGPPERATDTPYSPLNFMPAVKPRGLAA